MLAVSWAEWLVVALVGMLESKEAERLVAMLAAGKVELKAETSVVAWVDRSVVYSVEK